MDASCGDILWGGGPSIPLSATVLAAVTVAAASLEANTLPPSSVGVDVAATAITMAADVANDARYDPAVRARPPTGGKAINLLETSPVSPNV